MRAAKTQTKIRQEQIAAAALEQMARHGPKSLNIVRLARKVGVVPSAIYRHFQSKDAVLEAVLDLIAQRLDDNVRAVRQQTPDAMERLGRLLRRHVALIQNNIAIPRVVFCEEIFSGHPSRRRRVHRIIQEYLSQVADLVAEGQRAGSVRRDVSEHAVSVMFLGMIHPAVILWLTSDGAFDVGRHVEQVWPLFAQVLQTGSNHPTASSRGRDRRNQAKRKQLNNSRP